MSERLIVALDFPNIEQAKNLVNQLGSSVVFYKVGLELLMSGEYFNLIKWLESKNKKVFADLKLFDIPNTINGAIKNLSQYKNINFVTIHTASKGIMRSACDNKGQLKILAVTVLTCLDQNDLIDMNFNPDLTLTNLATQKAILAKSCGIDGIISSGFEVENIRKESGNNFTIVTPGIRINSHNNDQKRVVNHIDAINRGANHIVVGREIRDATNPREIAENIIKDISQI